VNGDLNSEAAGRRRLVIVVRRLVCRDKRSKKPEEKPGSAVKVTDRRCGKIGLAGLPAESGRVKDVKIVGGVRSFMPLRNPESRKKR